jgi:hypothetical protein
MEHNDTLQQQLTTIKSLVAKREDSKKELKTIVHETIRDIRWAMGEAMESLGITKLYIADGVSFYNNRFHIESVHQIDGKLAEDKNRDSGENAMERLDMSPVEFIGLLKTTLDELIGQMRESDLIESNARVIAEIKGL